RDVENGAVRGKPDVDRQAANLDKADDLHGDRVHLDDHSGEFRAGHQVAAVGREVEMIDATPGNGNAADQFEGMGIAKIQPAQHLGDDDRLGAVRGEVE